jgi:CRISPR-associated protein Cmr6
MSTHNNSLWYYKGYYADGVNASDKVRWIKDAESDKHNADLFKRRNAKLVNATLLPAGVWANPVQENDIVLQTTYPGLLLGSGYAHGSGLLGELKLGFFLDYTTGLPVVPGSSVKGVIRSIWPMQPKALKKNDLYVAAEQAMQYYVNEVAGLENWTTNEIMQLELQIFGAFKPDPGKTQRGTCAFHDAFPVRADANGKLLATDFITPHKEPMKNPIPIGFLKVLPEVRFAFRFDLPEAGYIVNGKPISADLVRKIFKAILLDYGVGAKTNVGYGQFTDPTAPRIQPRANTTTAAAATSSAQSVAPEKKVITDLEDYTRKLKIGDAIIGRVKTKGRDNFVEIKQNGLLVEARLAGSNCPAEIGDLVKLRVAHADPKTGTIKMATYQGPANL